MARFQSLLIGSLLLGVAFSAAAEDQDPSGEQKQKRGKNAELENVRKAIEALSPEQRKRFTQNLAKWANLSPEEKRALRDRDAVRRNRMSQDIERAAQEAGLQLKGPQRAQFAKRYVEERRRLEERLRRETEEKRAPGIQEIVERLKGEFATGNDAPVTAAPSAPPEEP